MRSSAIFFVSVVTSTRSLRSARTRISSIRSSTWLRVGRTSTSRIHQPGRTDDHLDDLRAAADFVRRRRRRNVHDLIDVIVELVVRQRTVVERAGQTEAVLDEDGLARPVAGVHGVHLRQRDVRLVDEEQPVLREEIDQAPRRRAGFAAGQMPRVVLDAVAVADFAQHLQVVARALLEPLRFEQFAVLAEIARAALRTRSRSPTIARRSFSSGVMKCLAGKISSSSLLSTYSPVSRIDDVDRLDRVAEELDAMDELFVHADELEHVAAHPERAAHQIEIVAPVLHVHEFAKQLRRGRSLRRRAARADISM